MWYYGVFPIQGDKQSGRSEGLNSLEKIKHTLFRSWYTLDNLEDRIYHIILDVAVFMSVPTIVFGIILHMPRPSIIMSVAILLYLIVLQYVTMRHPKYADLCRLLLVLGMNLVFLPVCFFTDTAK